RRAAVRADVVRARALVVPSGVAVAAPDRDRLAVLVVVAQRERGGRGRGSSIEVELRQVLEAGNAIARGAAVHDRAEPHGGAGRAVGELLAAELGQRGLHHAGRPCSARRVRRERAKDARTGSGHGLGTVEEQCATALPRAARERRRLDDEDIRLPADPRAGPTATAGLASERTGRVAE